MDRLVEAVPGSMSTCKRSLQYLVNLKPFPPSLVIMIKFAVFFKLIEFNYGRKIINVQSSYVTMET